MFLLISLIPVAHAQVKPKPTLRVNPPHSVYTGDTVTLTCDLQQGTGWKFIWYKIEQPPRREQEFTNTLTVTVDKAGEIEYDCCAYKGNYYTYYSDRVKITVKERPKAVVSIKPDTHVFIGERVTVRCDIQGGGRGTQWTYSWYKDKRYTGNMNQEFTISSVTDGGVYTCTGQNSNSQNSEISDAVTLTVSVKPRPTVRVNPQHPVYTGDTVTLTCDLQQGTGWKFIWYKYNQPLSGEQKSTNTLNVTVDKAGEIEYDCCAHRGDYYTDYSEPVKITVKERPKAVVTIKPDTHVFIGERVTVRCDIQGGGDTQWTYSWYKDKRYRGNMNQEFTISSVRDSDGGGYTCTGQNSNSQNSETSDAVTLTVSERPAVLSVSPQSWLTEGDSVTLNCEITNSSTNWTFSWYNVVPSRHGATQIITNHSSIMYVELLSDSSRGSGGSYTLSPAALKHTGVYVCRGERGKPALHTQYSNLQTLWITGESPPVNMIINPSRTQHFTKNSLSLSCEDQRHSTGWTVRRYTHSERVSDCSQWGSVTGSTCKISSLNTSHTGVYWCESESGESSNPVNITVHDGDVILESPVHPVTEGHPLTLRCLYRYTNPSNLRADFYKNESVVQNQTTGEMIIHNVSKSDEGFYHCKHPERGESPKSWVSVRASVSGSRSSGGKVGLAVGLVFLFIALLILMILLWFYKRRKDTQQKNNQTSEQNQSRSGAEDSQAAYTPLQPGSENIYSTVDQTGEAAAESNEATYSLVMMGKETNTNKGPDAYVTYAEIELEPVKKSERAKEKPRVADDTVYSVLQ
ncbi:cell adhesion molecule CEACAM5-like isoform 2-T2 [Clarias gariepinus]